MGHICLRSTNLHGFKSNQVVRQFREGRKLCRCSRLKISSRFTPGPNQKRWQKADNFPALMRSDPLYVDGESGCHLLFLSFNAAPSNFFCACLVKFARAATEILLLLTRALILQHSSSGGGKTFVTHPPVRSTFDDDKLWGDSIRRALSETSLICPGIKISYKSLVKGFDAPLETRSLTKSANFPKTFEKEDYLLYFLLWQSMIFWFWASKG